MAPSTDTTRQDIIRAQLRKADAEWSDALRELREALLGMAGEIDSLQRRVAKLECTDGERQRRADGAA
jgi:hypothetical protein